MEYKSFNTTIEEKDGGAVRAYASTFDREPDAAGDVVSSRAFDKTLANWKSSGKPIPLLWGHDTEDPYSNIGAATDYGVDERGLWFDADFDADNAKAQYVRKLVKEGRVFQCSFAYAVKAAEIVTLDDGRKANELQEVDVFEISIVQIPANQRATIEEVKSSSEGIPETMTEIKAGRRNSAKDADELSRISELCSSIQSIVNGLLAETREESDEQESKAESETEVKSEEPETANGEEPQAKEDVDALLQQANELLKEV